MAEVTEDAPIVKLVNLLISQAVADRASDIHIEPTEHDVRIRYRIDGVLHEVMRRPKNIQSGIISRLKIMADINIAERRVPQDGRMSATISGRTHRPAGGDPADRVRREGRHADPRQVHRAAAPRSDLGFLPESMARFEQSFRKPYGTILVTGPTGSGKSTTLYATLNIVNDESKNVITVEDPVEYRLPGVNQVQVNAKAGLTFAAALRSILRSDPDIVLVGEIRDKETATIAIEAALTGHLVLSTLHTNDAATTPHAAGRDGRRALPGRQRARLHRRPAAGPPALREVPAGLSAHRRRAGSVGWDATMATVRRRCSGPRVARPAASTGYQGPLRHPRGADSSPRRWSGSSSIAATPRTCKKMAIAQGMLTLRQAGLTQVARRMDAVEEILRVVA